MKNNRINTYYYHRWKLEKLKQKELQKSQRLMVLARVLFFLVNIADHYLRRS